MRAWNKLSHFPDLAISFPDSSRVRTHSQARGIAYDESGRQAYLGDTVCVAVNEPLKEHFYCPVTNIESRLNDRRDSGLKKIFGDQFVEGNKGDALRSGKAQRIQAH